MNKSQRYYSEFVVHKRTSAWEKIIVKHEFSENRINVHKLRPADIRVIAALGDSLTTAVGAQATGLSDLKTAWRGLSWSAGSDGSLENHTTLPNILKKFNPNLSGFSTGTEKETAGFNRAVGEAMAQ
ncbi:UNVERIFIED_CONTAM: Lysophospholipase 1 [Gekko kuhli]